MARARRRKSRRGTRARARQLRHAARRLRAWVLAGLGLLGILAAVLAARTIAPNFTSRSPPPSSADPDDPAQTALGAVLYARHCASCHGANLEGQPNWMQRLPDGRYPAPPHDASGHTWRHPDEFLFDVTMRGGQASAPAGFVSGMPAFGGSLADGEIWAVLAFIKSKWPEKIRDRQAAARP